MMATARLASLLLCLTCLLLNMARESMSMPAAKTSEPVANSTAVAAAAANTTTEAGAAVVGGGSIAKDNNYTNYALHDHKLLVNGSYSLDTAQLPRNIAAAANNAAGQSSAAGISITLMAVLLVVITLIISIILTAVFVMRRRFTIWRVNGDGRDDGAKGPLTKSSSSEDASNAAAPVVASVENETTDGGAAAKALTNNESKKSIECEKKLGDEEVKEVVASCIAELNSVENPQPALMCAVNEPAKTETTELKADEGVLDQQPSPATSETRLIAETPAAEQPPTAVTKSASTVSLSSSAVNPVSPIPSTNDLNPTKDDTVAAAPATSDAPVDTADVVVAPKPVSVKTASTSALNENAAADNKNSE